MTALCPGADPSINGRSMVEGATLAVIERCCVCLAAIVALSQKPSLADRRLPPQPRHPGLLWRTFVNSGTAGT